MFGLTNTSILPSALYRYNKRVLLHATISICVLIIGLSGLQVRAQTEFKIKPEKFNSEQQYKTEMDRQMLTAFEGDPQAQFRVGVLHTDTQFSPPNYEQAVYWYRQAARQGHTLAQYNLGHQYLMGMGVDKSETSAMKWWTEAAKQDHPLAQFNIGRAYYLGIGLKQDHKKSKYWFKRAAENQEQKSIEILGKLGWTDGAIDRSVAADFDIKRSLDASPKKTLQSANKPETPIIAQELKQPNQSSQLEIKSARDRQAAPDLRSKIIPIDLSKEPLAESIASSGESSNKKSAQSIGENETVDKPQVGSTETLLEPKNSPELKDSTELENSTEQKRSKLIITETKNKLGNLKPDEELAKQAPLNKTVKGELRQESQKKEPTALPLAIDKKNPVAIYTNPKDRSVLIAIVDDRTELTIVQAGSEWSSVRSKSGIPVWMHGDYLALDQTFSNNQVGNTNIMAIVTGDNVNTRSVPIVSPGTVVDRLNKGERVSVIDKRDEWYRVIAPQRFIAWVKTKDFNSSSFKAKPSQKQAEEQAQKPAPQKPQISSKVDSSSSDDLWLFQQQPSDFTLQLGSFVGAAKTQQYLSQINSSQNSEMHQIVSGSDDSIRTVFLYGAYKNRELADKAKTSSKQAQAWVRLIGGLQENRCEQWRKQKTAPVELKRYCKQ